MDIEIQSNIQRKIKLLELLASEKRWFKTAEITKIIGYSNKTINTDIMFINDFLPMNWKIEIKKGKGVQLHVPSSSSIDEINTLLFKESYAFKALHELFNHRVLTTLDLAETLYVSITSIPSILKSLEKYLNKFNLQLRRKPLKIVGDEIQIIMMFYELYLGVYGYYDWPFREYSESFFSRLINNIEEVLNLTLSLKSRKELSYFIAVLLNRKKQGNSIYLNEEFVYQNVNTPYYKNMAIVYEKLKKDHSIYLNTEEKIILTISIKCAKYILNDVEKEKNEILQDFKAGNVPVYNYVKDFICMLEAKLGRNLMHDEDMIFELIMYFRRKVYQLNYLSMITRTEKQTTKYIEQKHCKTFLAAKKVYTDWVRKYKIVNDVSDVEVARVTMYVEASYLLQKFKGKKALLVCGEGESWGKYITAMLFQIFGNKLEVVNDYSINLVDEEELDSDIDFIISTIPLNIDTIPIVNIYHIPTERDFMDIRYFISQK
ncbi:BglG family transcription antiterminator [Bacillus mycoides]|uniref:BglG family transcription antiterminator n=1 Tax=Bacillus mycoides TaxID=1405 RepID=UPI003D64C600